MDHRHLKVCTTLERHIGHPFTGKGDWDRLHVKADSYKTLDEYIARARQKFWQVWIRADNVVAAVLYKPNGAIAPWEDRPGGNKAA